METHGLGMTLMNNNLHVNILSYLHETLFIFWRRMFRADMIFLCKNMNEKKGQGM